MLLELLLKLVSTTQCCFGSDEIGHAPDAMWPDGGAGREYGESFARFAGASNTEVGVCELWVKEEL